jgi:diguanylate cyclase (GGDEF)-like protein
VTAAPTAPANATVRTVALAALLLSVVAVVPYLEPPARQAGSPHISLLLLAALFAVGGLLVFHLEFRDEAHSFLLSEVPLVLGLFLVDPWVLIVARLLGEGVALLLHPRQPWVKLVMNLSLWLAECVVALSVMQLLGWPSATQPWGWAAAFLAVITADVIGNATVYLVIRWHGARPQLGPLALAAGMTAVCNTCLGVLALLLVHVHMASLVVLGVLGAALFLAYRGYTDLHQRHASLQLLHDFGQATAGALRPDDVAEAMLHHARRLLRTEIAELVLLPADGPGARLTLAGAGPMTSAALGPDSSLFQPVLDARSPLIVSRGGQAGPLDDYLAEVGTKDAVLVAVELGGGARAVFAVSGRLADVSTLDEKDARLFATLARHAAAALEKGRLIDRLRDEARRREHQAMHDSLTELPNRASFQEQASTALERCAPGERVAVLLMDLDQFKQVNDTLGHQTGDELLQEVARRLRRAIRDGDFSARLGGDEFVVLVRGGSDEASVLATARRIAEAVQAPVNLRGLRLDVRVSMGIAVYPEHGTDVHGLLQRADVAMYAAKSLQDGPQLYRPETDQNTPRRLQLGTDLRRAIDNGQVAVHYQPQADLLTTAVTGVEALCRWSHPEHGPVSPDEFIPVAEQTGLIRPLTLFVVTDALSHCGRWQRAGHDLGVAVNVSARSLLDSGFVDDVLDLVSASGLRPELLTLEITESSIMSDTHRTLDLLHRLAGFGIRLSVDDFGTGYSSLAYLQQLPVHELKVDKSFVFDVGSDASSRAIVRSVVDLGHSLGLLVVAEGVEDEAAWDQLLQIGCDRGQGYLLSRPVSADDLTRWLQRTHARAVAG